MTPTSKTKWLSLKIEKNGNRNGKMHALHINEPKIFRLSIYILYKYQTFLQNDIKDVEI